MQILYYNPISEREWMKLQVLVVLTLQSFPASKAYLVIRAVFVMSVGRLPWSRRANTDIVVLGLFSYISSFKLLILNIIQ